MLTDPAHRGSGPAAECAQWLQTAHKKPVGEVALLLLCERDTLHNVQRTKGSSVETGMFKIINLLTIKQPFQSSKRVIYV